MLNLDAFFVSAGAIVGIMTVEVIKWSVDKYFEKREEDDHS